MSIREGTAVLVSAVVTALGLSVLSPAVAADELGWRLRVDLAWVDSRGDGTRIEAGGGATRISLGSGGGAGVRGEYQFSQRLGVELGVLGSSSVDLRTSAAPGAVESAIEVNTFVPISLGLNVHLTPGARPDLYIGPQLAYVFYEGVDVIAAPGSDSTGLSTDNDFGIGASIGLDVPIGERGWMVQFNLRFIDTTLTGRDGGDRVEIDYDPTIVAFGFGYRF